MRQIIFDTETTGFNQGGPIAQGHRVIEIGCVELDNRQLTGRHFHRYLNPGRAVDIGALEVHGLDDEFLSAQPFFADIAADLWAYLDGADELIAHNMPFDQAFLNQELHLNGDDRRLETEFVLIDTLALAKQTFYAQKYSLDALCKRFGIDNSKRELHGALLDAQLLTEVYLKLTGGQTDLTFQASTSAEDSEQSATETPSNLQWIRARATDAELATHQAILAEITASNPD